jgi:hypothetical protein
MPRSSVFHLLGVAGFLVAAGCGAPAPPTGRITVASSPPGAQVTLNGKVCAAPCAFDLAPGDYPVVATLLNHAHVEDTVTVTANGNAYKTLHLLRMLPTEEEAKQMHLRKKPAKINGAYAF